MENLTRITRSMIVQHRIDLISEKDLIMWADSVILSMDEPPSLILDISLGKIPVIPEQLDTVRNPICSADCNEILERVSEGLFKNEIDLNKVESICYQLALITDGDLSSSLHWISDEVYLCNEGSKELETSLPEIKKILNEITTSTPNKFKNVCAHCVRSDGGKTRRPF